MFADVTNTWTLLLTAMLAVHVAPAVFVVLRTQSFKSLALAVVICAIAYTILMPIPDVRCAEFTECAGDIVVDTLMKPFVLICWASLFAAAAIKVALLVWSRSRASSY